MSAAAIKAGAAFYEILATDKTGAALSSASARIQQFGRNLSVAGAALAGFALPALTAIGLASKRYADFGSEIADFSARTGVSTDMAQVFDIAAKQSSSSLSEVQAAIFKMQKQLAKTGEMKGVAPEKAMVALYDAAMAIEDPGERNVKLMETFGKSAAKLVPLMAAIKSNAAFLAGKNLLLSPEEIARADELGDSWDKLSMVMSHSWRIVGAQLAPAMIELTKYLIDAAVTVAQFVRANGALVIAAAKTAVGMFLLGTAIVGVGVALMLGVSMWGAAATVLGGIGTAFAFVGTAIASIFTPMGLMVVGIAALAGLLAYGVYAWFRYSDAGKFAVNLISKGLSDLWGIASQTFGGIFDAIMAGDWELAGEVAMAGISAAWQRGVLLLKEMWGNFKVWFLNMMTDIWAAIPAIMEAGEARIVSAINDIRELAGMDRSATGFLTGSGEVAAGDAKYTKEKRNAALAAEMKLAAKPYELAQKKLDEAVKKAADARQKLKDANAAKEKDLLAKIEPSKNYVPGGVDRMERKAVGMFSGQAAMRFSQVLPEFSALEEAAAETNEKLQQIIDNTEDMGPELAE